MSMYIFISQKKKTNKIRIIPENLVEENQKMEIWDLEMTTWHPNEHENPRC